ncbi:MAG: cobalt transporter CbiM [Gorillibacterium sp.]|nr:cobalt transporter CbiM [Gorillibacterium sp.]
MHIPDNYLSPSTCAVFAAVMLPVWRRASLNVKREITRQKMPLLGVGAAFSFLMMMFNLPLPGGTTGHAVGASLVAIFWGPYFAVISVSIALAIQALFFGDGGILSLGVNCFNMAFVMPFTAFYLFKLISSKFSGVRGRTVAAFIAGYLSLNVAAFLTSLEFGIQPSLFTDQAGLPLYGPYGFATAIPAMMIPHLLVAGVLEGLVTAGVYRYVSRVSPEFIYQGSLKKIKHAYLHLAAMILLTPLGLLAVGTAWGEWGPDELQSTIGYVPKGMKSGFQFAAPLADYSLSKVHEVAGYFLSALIGVALILLFFRLVGKVTSARARKRTND